MTMYELTYTCDTGERCTVIVTERGLRQSLAKLGVSDPTYRRLIGAEMRVKVAALIGQAFAVTGEDDNG